MNYSLVCQLIEVTVRFLAGVDMLGLHYAGASQDKQWEDITVSPVELGTPKIIESA